MTTPTALWILDRAIDRQRRTVLGLALEEGFDLYAMQRHINALRDLHRGYDTLLIVLAALCITSTHTVVATR